MLCAFRPAINSVRRPYEDQQLAHGEQGVRRTFRELTDTRVVRLDCCDMLKFRPTESVARLATLARFRSTAPTTDTIVFCNSRRPGRQSRSRALTLFDRKANKRCDSMSSPWRSISRGFEQVLRALAYALLTDIPYVTQKRNERGQMLFDNCAHGGQGATGREWVRSCVA
jgi:hypothetical protein